jgi:hypothetical protein
MNMMIDPFGDLPETAESSLRRAPLILGLLGLIPFIFGALIRVTLGNTAFGVADVSLLLLGYGAVILSFLGGVRWGEALYEEDDMYQADTMGYAVLPSIIGWVALLVPEMLGLILLMAGFTLQGWWDVSAARDGTLPVWYGKLRFILSSIVVTTLFITAMILFF